MGCVGGVYLLLCFLLQFVKSSASKFISENAGLFIRDWAVDDETENGSGRSEGGAGGVG